MLRNPIDDVLLMSAISLAQPGKLSDIAESYERLEPVDIGDMPSKTEVKLHLDRLMEQKYVWLYAGQRYMLTRRGERYIATGGLRAEIDGRRLYLLKETRKRSLTARSDARDRPLHQRS